MAPEIGAAVAALALWPPAPYRANARNLRDGVGPILSLVLPGQVVAVGIVVAAGARLGSCPLVIRSPAADIRPRRADSGRHLR